MVLLLPVSGVSSSARSAANGAAREGVGAVQRPRACARACDTLVSRYAQRLRTVDL